MSDRPRKAQADSEAAQWEAVVAATLEIPKVIRAIGEKASRGDVAAARLLFEIVGLAGRSSLPPRIAKAGRTERDGD